ncbi:deoxypodophyllotoxin synthase-like [Malus sylvestris]|uniref:deoxypodophyllotoxin synthase-like n=1 Tax=Malus sylvestris TaxID=3752 RepID=UPI0021AD3ADC|nr:deoxypodophyllotoxin synthase-like [Malus sylvestris]
MCKQSENGIPVIDFSKEEELKPGSSSWLGIREDVIRALEGTGCFIALVGDKVRQELRSTMLEAFKELMDFPREAKMKVKSKNKKTLGAYHNTTQIHESLAMDDAADAAECQKFSNLFWPNGNENFTRSSNEYATQMMNLDWIVTRMIFESYGVDNYHDTHINTNTHHMSFLKYERSEEIETDVGVFIHTDKNFTTVLHQVNDSHGLEVQNKNGDWVLCQPPPSSFTFIAGDILQVWSNDKIQACKHRVTISKDTQRFVLALFLFKSGKCQTPQELIDEEHPVRYKPIDQSEYFAAVMNNAINGGISYTVKDHCGITV